MAVSPWEVLRSGRRRRPWLSRYRWFLCLCELWFVGAHAKILTSTHSIQKQHTATSDMLHSHHQHPAPTQPATRPSLNNSTHLKTDSTSSAPTTLPYTTNYQHCWKAPNPNSAPYLSNFCSDYLTFNTVPAHSNNSYSKHLLSFATLS